MPTVKSKDLREYQQTRCDGRELGGTAAAAAGNDGGDGGNCSGREVVAVEVLVVVMVGW